MNIRKILTVIFALTIMLTACAVSVSADVIWEPSGDSFYQKHNNEITNSYHRRFYIANTDTSLYDEPNGKTTDTILAGESQGAEFFYTDKNNIQWGGFANSNDKLAWIKLSDYQLVYDNISFTEDHSTEFTSYNGELNGYSANGSKVYLWTYPNSDTNYGLESYPEDWTDYISEIYCDENDEYWGYIAYMWANSGWIYITDPIADTTKLKNSEISDETTTVTALAETLTQEVDSETVQTEISKADSITEATASETALNENISEITENTVINAVEVSGDNNNGFVIAGILVVAAAAVSVILLKLFSKKQ